MPVTTPELLTLATPELLLDHVPPEVGNKVDVVPMQIDNGPETLTDGLPKTVSGVEAFEIHPELVAVYVKVAVPAVIPVITPEELIWATAVLLLVHVPPVVGETVVLVPRQIVLGPV